MNEMTNDLVRTIDRIADDVCTKSLREKAESGEWPVELWRALEETGLTKATLPEIAGGADLPFADAMTILRRSAFHALPVPLAETMLAGRILVSAGLDVPEGPLTVVPVTTSEVFTVASSGNSFTVSGNARRIPWGNACKHAVIAADVDGKSVIGLIKTAGTVRLIEKNLAGEPRAHLEFNKTPFEGMATFNNARSRIELEGALYRSVQMASALERILSYSIQYANERTQFGRPIGKFQAVQHMLAVLAGHTAAASAAAHAAVEGADAAPHELAVAIAKARTGEAAGKGAEIAHQVHAAMGFTREHNLHFSTRRLWSWRDEFGNEAYWQTKIGKLVAAQSPDALWAMLTAL
jgi:acyl-CoA dehydrogenase